MKFFQKIINFFKPAADDPVHNCDVHKKVGCSHVDGWLCHMGTCEILSDYKKENEKK